MLDVQAIYDAFSGGGVWIRGRVRVRVGVGVAVRVRVRVRV